MSPAKSGARTARAKFALTVFAALERTYGTSAMRIPAWARRNNIEQGVEAFRREFPGRVRRSVPAFAAKNPEVGSEISTPRTSCARPPGTATNGGRVRPPKPSVEAAPRT